MFDFDDIPTDESYISEFCAGFEDSTVNEVDEFIIVEDCIVNRFEFKENVLSDDEFIGYNDFCCGFDTPSINELDEFSIVKDCIDKRDKFYLTLNSYLAIPTDPFVNVRYNTIGWHIAACIMNVDGHSLDKEVTGELMEKIFKENDKLNEYFTYRGRGIANQILGKGCTFFYKKAIENILTTYYIGERLHPSFKKINFKGNRKMCECIFGNLFRSLQKTSWIRDMGIKSGKTSGKFSSGFFYI